MPALEHRRAGKGKGHREPDVAGVENRRMHRERRVLQDRVEVGAVRRRRDRGAGTDWRWRARTAGTRSSPRPARRGRARRSAAAAAPNRTPPPRSTRRAPGSTAAATPRARPTAPSPGRTAAAPSWNCPRHRRRRNRCRRRRRSGSPPRAPPSRTARQPPGVTAPIQRSRPSIGPAMPKNACSAASSSARISANWPSSGSTAQPPAAAAAPRCLRGRRRGRVTRRYGA